MHFKVPLTQLLSDLWSKIKPDSSVRASYISEGDVVVFVVGPTGSGKSWFIKEATSSDLVKVSRNYHPCTTHVEAIRCNLANVAKEEGIDLRSIVLVDTPSFLTSCDQPDAKQEIKAWLERAEHKARYVGIIYMHRVETDPALEPISQHLQEFSTIRWINNLHLPQRVHVVISYDTTSANVTEEKIKERTSKLHAQIEILRKERSRWKLSLHQERFQGKPEVAWRAVEELFRDFPEADGPETSS